MARFNLLELSNTSGKSHDLLTKVKASMGMVPNLTKAMANSPAVLGAYVGFLGALGDTTLSRQLGEQISLVTAEANRCEYCLAAHTVLGGMAKLDAEAIANSRRGQSSDPKSQAALTFALSIIENRGHVSEAELNSVREAGFTDSEVLEIVANVVLNIFTNYFNSVAQTDIDFPAAPKL